MVRHKNRYFLIEVNEHEQSKDAPLSLKPSSLFAAILEAVSTLHGDFGLAAIRAGFIAKYCNDATRIAIIRVRHGPHKLVASSLPFITSIEERKASLTTLYTGATIKQCLNFLIAHQQRRFDEACLTMKNDEDKLALKDLIMNVDKALAMD